MSKLDHWIDNKIVQNAFVWFFFYLILLTTVQADDRIVTSLFILLLLAPVVYINNLFILPFLRTRLLVFFALFLINLLVFTYISVYIINTVSGDEFALMKFVNFFGVLILVLVFTSAIKIARDSFTRRQEEKEAELKLLKEQLNPHFLFNTLNNLYGLSVVKSDKLPDLMLKLSDLLRYSLYETKERFVPLEKEITYLENYMSLEKIRLEDTTDIQFVKSGNLAGKKIAPMLFIVFVENAFKHLGVIDDSQSKVSVTLHEENDRLSFTCINSTDTLEIKTAILEKEGSGIGLSNIKKRLELLYPNKHALSTTTHKNKYIVTLSLVF